MKLFFFILYLGVSLSLACPPNSPYEGMAPLFSWSRIGQIIFHSYLPTEVSSSAYLAKTAAEKSEIIWNNMNNMWTHSQLLQSTSTEQDDSSEQAMPLRKI